MDDLIVRETTTVPGIVNLAGVAVLVAAKSVRPFADRIAAWLLLFTWMRQKELNSEESERFWEVIRSAIPPPMTLPEFAIVAVIFIAYNVACVWIVGGNL